MSVVMDDSLTSLKSECDNVKSLYYRNKNQHGASYLFQMLHKLVKLVSERYDWDFLADLDKVWATIRTVVQKSGRECSERLCTLIGRLYEGYQINLLVLECCRLCVVEAKNYLEQKVFVSLSTFIVAAISRIYKIVFDLTTSLADAYALLKDHFKADLQIRRLPTLK